MFSPSHLKNDLLSSLSDYIGDRLVEEMGIDELALIRSEPLDFWRIHQELENIF